MERFSGGGVEMRFFTDLERSLFCGVEMEREERMMSTAVLREIERGVCLCGGCRCVFVCGVWSIGAR